MPRNRVLSFMSQWGSHSRSHSRESSPAESPRQRDQPGDSQARSPVSNGKLLSAINTSTAQSASAPSESNTARSPPSRSPATPSRARADSRAGSRPLSMVQTYQPPQVDVYSDTPPELQPIFSYLNSHGNKLYQEGYFLKLHDLDARGRPSAERVWVECFAQLVGTVLSLWDAAALDAAGVDGEVVPTFINLSDASLKMIESLPMSGAQGGRLQNVLSISTAANNRYLLHFNSLNSLTQWTAGIRLAMFEHTTLQEAYTGSLIAGKGRSLNGIKDIMERSRFPTEDWARVRFGAGTPWRRLWFVITPPDEKEFQKVNKMQKKGVSYLRSQMPRGDIKFYETRKVTKKTKPIATIVDVYAAYAIYPQSKPLIEQSTLVKMEGQVTIHTAPETTAEGFVFIMPEVHPAVSGFEMMLRWLFPVWDTFNLYGRPTRLIADPLDQRGLMFAMPRDKRYGYLDILDVSGLIHENGSQTWSERQWRKQMKKLTAERMNAQLENGPYSSQRRSMTGSQSSLPAGRQSVRFNDTGSNHSVPSRGTSPAPANGVATSLVRSDAMIAAQRASPHKRAASEVQGYKRYQTETPSRLSQEMARGENFAPTPPRHMSPVRPAAPQGVLQRIESGIATPTMASLQAGLHPNTDPVDAPPEPISTPPAFTHNPGSRPANAPAAPPELIRAYSAVDAVTMQQMQDAVRPAEDYEEDHGNLASNAVETSQIARRPLADRSQGPPTTHGNITPLPGQEPLHTISGSPRMDEEQTSIAQRAHPLPLIPGEQYQRPAMPASRSSASIARKPVRSSETYDTSPTTSNHGSLTSAYIDNAALEHILQQDARLNSMGSIESSATPDYASTISASSRQGKTSPDRPRAGRLRTVGDPDMAPIGNTDQAASAYAAQQTQTTDIPSIDFGATYSYKDTISTDPVKNAKAHNRSGSRDRLSIFLPTSARTSPSEANRLSYFDDRTAADLIQSGNSTAWTPAMRSSKNNSISLTPEQWVQHRASLAAQPQIAPRPSAPSGSHSRQSSTSTLSQRRLSKTPPPFGRSGSGDWSHLGQQTPPPSRPMSRGAQSLLGRASPGLPLQETSHIRQNSSSRPVSRGAQSVFGRVSPGLPWQESTHMRQYSSSRPATPGTPTLMANAVARERERAAFREGLRNSMVDEAVRSRQQQGYQSDMEVFRQAAIFAQQQNEYATWAYQAQQNAHSPSSSQSNRQSWLQPRQEIDLYGQQMYAQQARPSPLWGDSQQSISGQPAHRAYQEQQARPPSLLGNVQQYYAGQEAQNLHQDRHNFVNQQNQGQGTGFRR